MRLLLPATEAASYTTAARAVSQPVLGTLWGIGRSESIPAEPLTAEGRVAPGYTWHEHSEPDEQGLCEVYVLDPATIAPEMAEAVTASRMEMAKGTAALEGLETRSPLDVVQEMYDRAVAEQAATEPLEAPAEDIGAVEIRKL